MMIGEIRDEETANVAVQAALTGHSILSTLHTNNAAGSIQRLSIWACAVMIWQHP
jgi:type II secretory ATPase GspE/PulE/Tfp pilus assembly ATPase PilB-like protein